MLVLGAVLILLSAGVLVAVLASGTDEQAALYGGTLEVSTLLMFLAGAATLLLFIMGLELARSGVRRSNRNRKAAKRLRKLEKDEGVRDGERGPAPATHSETGSTQGSAEPPDQTPPPSR